MELLAIGIGVLEHGSINKKFFLKLLKKIAFTLY